VQKRTAQNRINPGHADIIDWLTPGACQGSNYRVPIGRSEALNTSNLADI
jgi:hypothetical protein